MKRLLIALLMLLCAVPLAAQDPTVTMSVSQKVKLTLTGYDAGGSPLPPGAVISGWSVEGSSKDNVLGAFEAVYRADGSIEPLAAWFIPVKTGTFRIQGSFAVPNPNGQLPPPPGMVRSTAYVAWVTVIVS